MRLLRVRGLHSLCALLLGQRLRRQTATLPARSRACESMSRHSQYWIYTKSDQPPSEPEPSSASRNGANCSGIPAAALLPTPTAVAETPARSRWRNPQASTKSWTRTTESTRQSPARGCCRIVSSARTRVRLRTRLCSTPRAPSCPLGLSSRESRGWTWRRGSGTLGSLRPGCSFRWSREPRL